MAPPTSASRRRGRWRCCRCATAATAPSGRAPRRARRSCWRSMTRPIWLSCSSRFGWRAGRFVRIGRRASYPLKLIARRSTVARRTVLIGNAAQALHPIAGPGIQPGRCAMPPLLAELIAGGTGDVGLPSSCCASSRDARAADRGGVVRFTDGLVRSSAAALPGVGLLRNLRAAGCSICCRPPSARWRASAWVSAARRRAWRAACRCRTAMTTPATRATCSMC